jgi:hypothetical protein
MGTEKIGGGSKIIHELFTGRRGTACRALQKLHTAKILQQNNKLIGGGVIDKKNF